jgi:hypothetical protein
MGRTADHPTYGQRPQYRVGPRKGTRPFSESETARLLCCIPDGLERHHKELKGFWVGRRIYFPRWAIDRLVADPDGELDQPPVERALVMLPLLTPAERLRVAQAALAPVGVKA